jgi:hypothetical protein
MQLSGAPLAALEVQGTEAPNRERRDRQLDGPNAPGWVAREERAATSVRRVGGEATLRALAFKDEWLPGEESSARRVASAAARFAGRGPFLTLRRCEGDRAARDEPCYGTRGARVNCGQLRS